jgi:hypothetical protein
MYFVLLHRIMYSQSINYVQYVYSRTPHNTYRPPLPQLALILGTLGVFVAYLRSGQRQQRLLPLGPRKLPFIGNLLSMPSGVE